MNNAERFLRKHSSTILTVLGAAGVGATAVLSVKATPKALKMLDDAEKAKGDNLTYVEKIKTAWKLYIPAGITGISTMACIFGINYLSIKNQASLMSAYALLDSSYRQYQNKVKDIHGKDADINVKQEIVKTRINEDIILEEGELLFFDMQSGRAYASTMEDVCAAECKFLESLEYRGNACLNEYYDYVGLPPVDYGYSLGWFAVEDNDPYNCHGLEFTHEKIMINDDIECFVITPSIPASYDYIISSTFYKPSSVKA